MVKTFLLNSSAKSLAIHLLLFLLLWSPYVKQNSDDIIMDDSQFSQTKKAKAARKWRATNTLKKRFDGPLKEYIRIKYCDIYDEYLEFYQRLDKENPDIRDLSKTQMFRKWAKRVQKQLESQQTQSLDEGEVSGQVQNEAVINQSDHQQESQPGILSKSVQKQLESQQTQSSDEGEVPGQVQNEAVINQSDHQQESQPNILSLAIQEILPQDIPNSAIQEILPQDIPNSVMQQILPEGIPNQISASLQEFLPQVNHEHNETLSCESIEDIINELEQNEAVRNILNPVVDEIIDRYNMQITPDDDEGIELNFIDEIDLQPFDYDLEVDF